MYTILLAPLLAFIITAEVTRFLKARKITAFAYSMLWFSIIYCAAPLYITIIDQNSANPYFHISTVISEQPLSILAIFLSAAGLYLGHNLSKRHPTKLRIDSEITTSSEKKLSAALFLIGIVSLLYFFSSYGGFSYVIEKSQSIRYGGDEIKDYAGSFVKLFSIYITISFLIYFSNWASPSKNTTIIPVLFLFSFAAFNLYISAGRESFINLLLYMLIVSLTVRGGKIKLLNILLILAFSAFFVVYGKIFIFELFSPARTANFSEISEKVSFMSSLALEFSHQYLSIPISLDHPQGSRAFSDYFLWALKWLKFFGAPQSIDAISYANTFYITGYWKSVIPPGIVAFSIYNGTLLLVLPHSMAIGFMCGQIDSLFSETKKPLTVTIYAIISLSMSAFVRNSDFSLYVQSMLPVILLIILLWAFRAIKLKKPQNT